MSESTATSNTLAPHEREAKIQQYVADHREDREELKQAMIESGFSEKRAEDASKRFANTHAVSTLYREGQI